MVTNKQLTPTATTMGDNYIITPTQVLYQGLDGLGRSALRYALAGEKVIPCNPKGKAPYPVRNSQGAGGVLASTSNPETVRTWWLQYPEALIGRKIPERYICIDIDPRNGGNLRELETALGEAIPLVCVVHSGRGDGGQHIYLQKPLLKPGEKLTGAITINGNKLPGIDVLHGNKYTIMPPSPHPETKKPYTWARYDTPPPCPPALAEAITKPVTRVKTIYWDSYQRGHEPNTPNGLVAFVEKAQPGERNNILFWAFCTAIEQHYPREVMRDIAQAGKSIGLSEQEIVTTLKHASTKARG